MADLVRLKGKIVLSVFLLTLFVSYQVSITMFTHVHYVNGVMVVHSHPSKDKHHAHTASQIVVLGQLSHILTPKAEAVCVQTAERPLLYVLTTAFRVSFVEGIHLKSLSLRAPPVNG